jgi:hypothetical protein
VQAWEIWKLFQDLVVRNIEDLRGLVGENEQRLVGSR